MAGTILRVLWFCLIGWWLGPLWLLASVALMLSILFFPLGAYTATKTWRITTLKENPRTVVVNAQAQKGD